MDGLTEEDLEVIDRWERASDAERNRILSKCHWDDSDFFVMSDDYIQDQW